MTLRKEWTSAPCTAQSGCKRLLIDCHGDNHMSMCRVNSGASQEQSMNGGAWDVWPQADFQLRRFLLAVGVSNGVAKRRERGRCDGKSAAAAVLCKGGGFQGLPVPLLI